MPLPPHSSRFCHQNNIWWAAQNICSLTYSPVSTSLLGPTIFLSTLLLNNPSLRFSLNIGERQSFTPIQNHRQNFSSVYLILYIANWKTKDSAPNYSNLSQTSTRSYFLHELNLYLKSLFFWDVTHRKLVVSYGRFGGNLPVPSTKFKQSKKNAGNIEVCNYTGTGVGSNNRSLVRTRNAADGQFCK
jgi:hypothetical protein